MADPIEALRTLAASSGGLSSITVNHETGLLTIPSPSTGSGEPLVIDAKSKHTLTLSGKSTSKEYALGALYLLLRNPDESYVKYRTACKELDVEAVKVTERKDLIGHFGLGDGGAGGGAEETAEEPAAAAGEAAASEPADDEDKKSSSRDRRERDRRDKRRSKDRRHRSSSSSSKERKRREREEAERKRLAAEAEAEAREAKMKKKERAKSGMTNEQLMEGLDVVVDKRDEEVGDTGGKEGGGETGGDEPTDGPGALLAEEEPQNEEEERRHHAQVIASLSSEGFEVWDLADAIEADRPAVERIASQEIPVGNSASVLRCGAGAGDDKRDFTRVLELYIETVKAEEKNKHGGSSSRSGPPGSDRKRPSSSSSGGGRGWGQKDPKRSKGPGGASAPSSATKVRVPTGKPIIVVPNAMTSPITLINSADFFGNATFVPRDVALKRAGGNASHLRKNSITVKHKVAPRLGGGEIEFEIVDNPSTKLRSGADWDRVVAVVAQGAEWQFKSWRYSRPVDLFGRCFGFYIGIENAPVPKELQGWQVKVGKLNRDKRGLDSVTFADFWNGLAEWMHVHKPEYLKLQAEQA